MAELGDIERRGELADQKLRIIDLDRRQCGRQLELERRRALESEVRAFASHLDTEGISGNGLRGAILRAARLRLARTPGGDLRLGPRSGIGPQRGPADGQQHHQRRGHEEWPAPAAGHGVTCIRHHWRSCAGPVAAGASCVIPAGSSQDADCGVSEVTPRAFSGKVDAGFPSKNATNLKKPEHIGFLNVLWRSGMTNPPGAGRALA